jgi:hypothetical protein
MHRDLAHVFSQVHAALHALEASMLEASTASYRKRQFDRFARALGGHLRAIDMSIVPTLASHGWRDVPSSFIVGHADATLRLAELIVLKESGASSFEQELLAYLPVLSAQLHRERSLLVPVAQRVLSPAEDRSLAAQVAAQFKMMFDLGDESAEYLDANDLFEEARVVLSTLPSRGAAHRRRDGARSRSAKRPAGSSSGNS